jgi:hypothetical protein
MGRNHSEDLGIYERIILKIAFGNMVEGVQWIDLARKRDL